MLRAQKRWKSFLLFGSDQFSVTTFDRFLKNDSTNLTSVHAVCPPTPPNGAFRQYCRDVGIETFIAPPDSLAGWLPPLEFDIGLVASFGYFIPANVIGMARICMLNAHPSLLPRYRGASPIQHAIMNGDMQTGVTIIDLDPSRFDAGSIWHQAVHPIGADATFSQLQEELAILSGELLAKVCANLSHFQNNCRKQEGPIVKAPRITTFMGHVSVNELSALQIYARYRALGHQVAIKAKLCNHDKHVIFEDISSPYSTPDFLLPSAPIGSTFYQKKPRILWIRCKGSFWLPVGRFKVEGKSNVFSPSDIVNSSGLENFKTLFVI